MVFGVQKLVESGQIQFEVERIEQSAGVAFEEARGKGEEGGIVLLKAIFAAQDVEEQIQFVACEHRVVLFVLEERAQLVHEGQRRIARAWQIAFGAEAAARVEKQRQEPHADRNPQCQAQRWAFDEETQYRVVGMGAFFFRIQVLRIDETDRAIVEIGQNRP